MVTPLVVTIVLAAPRAYQGSVTQSTAGARTRSIAGRSLSPPTFPIDNARARPHRPAVRLQLETGMAANRPHYHLWCMSRLKRAGRVGGIWYPLVRGFHTRQAAGQWGKRNRPDRERMILKCDGARCAPKLD